MTPLLEQARRALCDSNKELLSVRNSIGNDRMPHDGDEFHERLSANVAAIKALEAEQMKPDNENSVEYWKVYSEAQDSSFDVMMVELKLLRAAQTVGSTVKQPLSIERAVEPFAWVVLDYEDVPIYCAPAKQMCNDHINEAISEYCIAEAGGWSIREAFSHPAPPPAEPTVKQPLSTERAELLAELRCRFVGDPFPLMDKAADMLEADAPSANYVMLEQVVIALTDENTKLAGLLEQAQQVAVPAAKQPLSTERAELVAHLRNHSSKLGNQAADMLEADVSLIDEGNKAQQVTVNHGCRYPMCHSEGYQQAVTAKITAELWTGVVVPPGYALVPLEPTPEMIAIGGHVNSEWLNDNAPIGERRYAMPMKSVYEAMLAAAPQPPQGDKK